MAPTDIVGMIEKELICTPCTNALAKLQHVVFRGRHELVARMVVDFAKCECDRLAVRRTRRGVVPAGLIPFGASGAHAMLRLLPQLSFNYLTIAS